MTVKTKQTSLQKLVAALTEHGWEFEQTEVDVLVPDTDNPRPQSRYSSRQRYPLKRVSGVKVSASNGLAESRSAPFSDGKSFSASFVDGRYVASETKGSYPFVASEPTPLKKVLWGVEHYAPGAAQKRIEKRAAEEREEEAKEEREVAEAYRAAVHAEQEAKTAAMHFLMVTVGLSAAQANKVMEEAQKRDGNVFSVLAGAQVSVERTGKGWVPGRSYVSGTYVDGKKVS